MPTLKDQSTVLALIAHHAQEPLTARADAEAKALVAHTRIAEQRPAVEAFRRLADADGTWCISDAAKALGIRPSELSKWLRDDGWVFARRGSVFARRGSKRILAHQTRINDGTLVHKVTLVPDDDGGNGSTRRSASRRKASRASPSRSRPACRGSRACYELIGRIGVLDHAF